MVLGGELLRVDLGFVVEHLYLWLCALRWSFFVYGSQLARECRKLSEAKISKGLACDARLLAKLVDHLPIVSLDTHLLHLSEQRATSSAEVVTDAHALLKERAKTVILLLAKFT